MEIERHVATRAGINFASAHVLLACGTRMAQAFARSRLRLCRVSQIAAGVLIALASACAYDPPVAGDRSSSKFQADLAECRATGTKAAHHAVISRGLLFMTYPISFPLIERRQTRQCMVTKGYQMASR